MRKLAAIVFMICIITVSIFVSEAEDTGMGTGEERSELYKRLYENGVTYITLYYQDDGGNLIPVTREVPKQEGIARAAIEGLIDSAATREELKYYGLYPVLPPGAKIQGLVIYDGVAKIDFNSGIRNYYNEKAERNAVASVIYTLTEFASVKKVVVMMDGRPMERLKTGIKLPEYLSRENTMINSNKLINEEGASKADIFFWKSYLDRFEYYLPVSVKLGLSIPEDIEKADNRRSENIGRIEVEHYMKEIVQKFTEVPSDLKGINGNITNGLTLVGSSVDKDLLTLNFSEQFENILKDSEQRRHFLNQIMYTAKQIPGISRVKFLINGKSIYLPEAGDFSKAIRLPSGANSFIDENAGWGRQQDEEIRSSYEE